MSEEKEIGGIGAEGIIVGLDPAAAALVLAGASRKEADAYLDDQRHHIHEQLKQIHLDILEKWLGVALRLATLIVGLAIRAEIAANNDKLLPSVSWWATT